MVKRVEDVQRAYDVLGNIALVRFKDKASERDKKSFGRYLLETRKNVTTVLEKVGKIKGRLRKQSMAFIAGEDTREVLYRENGCTFRFHVESSYFSPRLSNERKELSTKVRKGESVLVLFAGVAPFSIVIGKHAQPSKVVSVEINREASRYAKQNVVRNKLTDVVEVVQRNAKLYCEEAKKRKETFDVIVMARPQLNDTFLSDAFKVCAKGTRIYYYDFCGHDEMDDIVAKVKDEAVVAKKKIRILSTKTAGEIAPYRNRVRIDFIVQ